MGLVIITALIALSIYTVIAIPYSEGMRLWRGGEDIWIENPRNARPSWVNFFLKERLPQTIIVDTQPGAARVGQPLSGGLRAVEMTLAFDYPYDAFPSEINLFLKAKFKENRPYVSFFWLTPDGQRIPLGERSVRPSERYSISLDRHLAQRLGRRPPEIGLFTKPNATVENAVPLKGRYQLQIEGFFFEEGSNLEAKLVVYGQVDGLAGTDHRRRDLMVALLWGTPVALAFGFLAAVGST